MPAWRSRRRSASWRVGSDSLSSGRKETTSASPKPPSSTRCASGGSKLHSSKSDTTRKARMTRNGHSNASQTRSPRRASQLSRTRRSKRRASALTLRPFGGGCLGSKHGSRHLHRTQQAATRTIWGAKRAKARLIHLTWRLKASLAAAPWPACRRSSVSAASRYNGSRPPAPRGPEACCYTPTRARRHRRLPSSQK